MSELLRHRDPEILLRNAHRLLQRTMQFRGQVLSVLVSEVTGYGSTYSNDLCHQLGWNPNALVTDPLPPRRPPPQEAESIGMLSASDAIERLCHLTEEVHAHVGYEHPADCFCRKGGFWGSADYGGTYERGYRNDGRVVLFIEQAVREKLARKRQ